MTMYFDLATCMSYKTTIVKKQIRLLFYKDAAVSKLVAVFDVSPLNSFYDIIYLTTG